MSADHDEVDRKSESINIIETRSGDDQDTDEQPKKKRYQRQTQHQITEMENFFKECPHPDDKQTEDLGRRLGLEPLQVRIWFETKCIQMKAHHEGSENTQLGNENEKLPTDISYKEALADATCLITRAPAAIGETFSDGQHLRTEDASSREEIGRSEADLAGIPIHTYPQGTPTPAQPSSVSDSPGVSELLPVSVTTEGDKQKIIEMATLAMEELVTMSQAGEPLWISPDIFPETLNKEEYMRVFSREKGRLGIKSEASRETAVVFMHPLNLVEILMDVNQWENAFLGIVSRASTLEVLSTGVAENYNGAMQLMTAEFQVPSPLVPARESCFLRYCKQHADGKWAVVDVSLDTLRLSAISQCRKRPSGCLIEGFPNGYSTVTWVEHVEVDDREVHSLYKPLVNSGLAFGAKRWVTTLDRHCERLARAMAYNMPAGDVGVITSPEERKSVLELAERMLMSFYSGVGASTADTWTTLTGSWADDVRIMTRKNMAGPGMPHFIVISAATSLWLPVTPRRVFDFLQDENSRREWDILLSGVILQEIAHIFNCCDHGNSVSLLRVNSETPSQSNMMILRESCIDSTGSYIISAPIDEVGMDMVLSGGDLNHVELIPCGFAILPDGPTNLEVESGGSLLTVGYQITYPTAELPSGSEVVVNRLIERTVERIKNSLRVLG